MFIIGTTIYAQSVYPSDNLFYSLGRLIKSQHNVPKTRSAGKIYSAGKDITITWDGVNEIKERMDLAKLVDSEENNEAIEISKENTSKASNLEDFEIFA
ncbi:hypothetical protein C3B58_07290 [Lactonifactor longoviformis]|uniref:hypothetical protein n=1 Tax=Lactonifactor longoviformis TaxID=341220 RepID=UPI0009326241|nr:hypothetical protein [Lactonifactor longoviformis]POP33482.1 hypothetical protein C3B58_07290 [Lactonifactor longoviformis]